jgi:hypothetical protein
MREKLSAQITQAAQQSGFRCYSAALLPAVVEAAQFPIATIVSAEASGALPSEARTALYDVVLNLLIIKDCRADDAEPYYAILERGASSIARLLALSSQVLSAEVKKLKPLALPRSHRGDVGLEVQLRVALFAE